MIGCISAEIAMWPFGPIQSRGIPRLWIFPAPLRSRNLFKRFDLLSAGAALPRLKR
jgi:hypothetical protein